MEAVRQGEPGDGLGSTKTTVDHSAEAQEIIGEFHDLDFAVHRSRRYHDKLAAFYGAWRDWARIVTALAGSGAFVLVVADTVVGKWLAGFVALWAVLDIIAMPDKKAQAHSDLSKRFTSLAARIAETAETKEALRALKAARLLIEEGEPPCRRLVDLEARNDECRARGYSPDEIVPLSWKQRRFGRFFDFDMGRLEDWKAERQRAARSAA